MCSNIGTPKTINFPFGTNGKLMVLGVPIHKHFRVYEIMNVLEKVLLKCHKLFFIYLYDILFH